MSNRLQQASRSEVIALYNTMLGREPENEKVINDHLLVGSLENIIRGIGSSVEFQHRVNKSPFFHYSSSFDAQEMMRRYAASKLKPTKGHLTTFLGVVINTKFLPEVLTGKEGCVEDIPIPANWHADIAEWAAALRSVDLAKDTFTMIELGCGWGCWMNNTGVAAKRKGLKVRLIGIEGDKGHVSFAHECCITNGFTADEFTVYRGIAAATSGKALFPRQDIAGQNWGLEPLFNVSRDEHICAMASGKFDELPMIPLADVIGERSRVDLLHMDVQGGEADLIDSCLPLLAKKIAYIIIGAHSRQIEGRLFSSLLEAGWRLEIERPAILVVDGEKPSVTVDGVQGWRNMKLLPR